MEVRRSAKRARTDVPGGVLRHALSAGAHYDPANTSFGPLVLHDEVHLEPGAGFPDHPHAGVAVVTHVVAGALRHRDALGHDVVLRAGDTGVMTTGAGVVHAEHAGPDGARYVQAFLLDDAPPAHTVHPGARQVAVAGCLLRVLSPAPGEPAVVAGGRVHLHLVTGALDRPAALLPGDAVRAAGRLELVASAPSLALAWSLPA